MQADKQRRPLRAIFVPGSEKNKQVPALDRRRSSVLWLGLCALLLLLLSACQVVQGSSFLSETEETGDGTGTRPAATPTRAGPTAAPETPTPSPSPTLTLLSGGATAGDPFTPELGNTGYDVQHYHLQLAIDPAAERIESAVSIEARTTMPNLRQISLDFVGFEISSLAVDGLPAAHHRENGKLWVEFPQPILAEGTSFVVEIAYAGRPVQEDSPYIHYVDYLGLIFPGNGTFYTLSEPDGARYWFPANDHPLDKATFRTELTVPEGLAAISNGRLVDSFQSTMPGGGDAATFIWEHDYPLATYLALAAGGHYLRVEDQSPGGIPLVYYYFPEFEEEYLEAVEITGEAIDWMSERFGPYPFDSYGQATYYALDISMEMQTMTLLSFQMLDERTVVHELAHSWFGNWVGLDNWGDTWRKEGLATYMEVLWLARDNPAEVEGLMAEIEEEVAERGRDYPLDNPPRERILSFDSYNRGALLMHALHQEVGDDAFFQGLRTYVSRYGGSSSGQEDFEAVMEEAAGRQLDAFFAQWLAGQPVP